MLKNNGFTVLATVEIRGKNIFVYTISTMMHSKLDLKRVKKILLIYSIQSANQQPYSTHSLLLCWPFICACNLSTGIYAFATSMSCICIGWPFCSLFTADTQQRYLTFPGTRMNPGSSAPSPRTASCKSGRWWVKICGSILYTGFGELMYSVPQLHWTMSVFQYLNHMQWSHWMW